MKLTDSEISDRLTKLPGWTLDGNALYRKFEFSGFPQAFAFMTAVALHAQRMDHHPDWSNVYNKVEIRLSSHDVGGISDRDFRLANLIDSAV